MLSMRQSSTPHSPEGSTMIPIPYHSLPFAPATMAVSDRVLSTRGSSSLENEAMVEDQYIYPEIFSAVESLVQSDESSRSIAGTDPFDKWYRSIKVYEAVPVAHTHGAMRNYEVKYEDLLHVGSILDKCKQSPVSPRSPERTISIEVLATNSIATPAYNLQSNGTQNASEDNGPLNGHHYINPQVGPLPMDWCTHFGSNESRRPRSTTFYSEPWICRYQSQGTDTNRDTEDIIQELDNALAAEESPDILADLEPFESFPNVSG